jgi:hypothetical protein
LNWSGANFKWKTLPDTFHGFDRITVQTYLAQGVTAKNCSVEVLLTNVAGGSLGEAHNYKTGATINDKVEWNQAFAGCNSHGFNLGANASAKEQATTDVHAFVR